jgi:hypothetical protein
MQPRGPAGSQDETVTCWAVASWRITWRRAVVQDGGSQERVGGDAGGSAADQPWAGHGCPRPVSCGRASRSWLVRTCDDLRLVGLKLIFLTVSSAMSLLRLSCREEWWKDAEIVMLRHQLAVALRERPRAAARLTWPDRAWLALLAGSLPIDRLAGMRPIVTPATMAQHQDLGILPPRLTARQTQHRHGPGNNQEDQPQAHKPTIIARPARPRPGSHTPDRGPSRRRP